MENKPRPKLLLEVQKKNLATEWKLLQFFHDEKEKGNLICPDWCYMPILAYYTVLTENQEKGLDIDKINLVGVFAALDAWRLTQGIYRFDNTLYESLLSTEIDDKIPCEVLLRLPEWCIYIETPERKFLDFDLFGFFCYANEDEVKNKRLNFILDVPEKGIFHIPFQLKATVAESFEAFLKFFTFGANFELLEKENMQKDDMKKGYMETLKLLPLVLYLCSQEPDLTLDKQKPVFQRPQAKKIKGGYKFFDSTKIKNYEVGYKIGKFIREYKQKESYESAETGRSVAPHIRRAHFHLYHTGKGRQDSILKWLPPIPVNIDDDIIPTIKMVK